MKKLLQFLIPMVACIAIPLQVIAQTTTIKSLPEETFYQMYDVTETPYNRCSNENSLCSASKNTITYHLFKVPFKIKNNVVMETCFNVRYITTDPKLLNPINRITQKYIETYLVLALMGTPEVKSFSKEQYESLGYNLTPIDRALGNSMTKSLMSVQNATPDNFQVLVEVKNPKECKMVYDNYVEQLKDPRSPKIQD